MTNDLLKFARWVDDFEQTNRDRKFASIEEALQVYRLVEGELSEAEKFAASIPDHTNGVHAEENHALSLEIIDRAKKDPDGEYFYLVYTPGPNGSNLMDMSVKNGRRLVDVLASYALQQNAGDKVARFTAIVSRILLIAQTHILNETARRAKNN